MSCTIIQLCFIIDSMKTITKKLGDNVKKLRQESRLSQSELAAELAVDKSYISNIENGKKNPTLKTIEKIAQVLGVSPDKLIN
jgi:transcriptional regulator with XRE-family HTH domain